MMMNDVIRELRIMKKLLTVRIQRNVDDHEFEELFSIGDNQISNSTTTRLFAFIYH